MSIIKKIEQAQIEKLRATKKSRHLSPVIPSKYTSKSRMATSSASRFSKALLSPVTVVTAIMHLLPFVANHTVSVWNVNSRCTARRLKKSKRFALVRFVVQNCSSCVDCPAKRRVSSKICRLHLRKRQKNRRTNNVLLYKKIPRLRDFLLHLT